jgi:hypothetical protein
MAKVNINDRRSLERAYPRNAFAGDAAHNARGSVEVVNGVRIASAPDATGCFDVEPASRHIGEPPSPYFLSPVRRTTELVDAGHAPRQVASPQPDDGYEQFLDAVMEAAQRHGFRPEEAPGRNEPRLRGFRGG